MCYARMPCAFFIVKLVTDELSYKSIGCKNTNTILAIFYNASQSLEVGNPRKIKQK